MAGRVEAANGTVPTTDLPPRASVGCAIALAAIDEIGAAPS
jgi:hypothetical protein